MPLYGDILQANFFDRKNSIKHQINGNLEPLKGFGINFFGLYGKPLETPKKPCLNSWQGSAKLSPQSLSPPPSDFRTDEDSVNRSAMDTLRYSKK
jgi:hypothetical protein